MPAKTKWKNNSRFNYNTELYYDNDQVLQADYRFPETVTAAGDNFYTIEPGFAGRPDLIALKFYDNSKLDWTIYLANDFDHVKEFYVGRIIRIPDLAALYGIVI